MLSYEFPAPLQVAILSLQTYPVVRALLFEIPTLKAILRTFAATCDREFVISSFFSFHQLVNFKSTNRNQE